jgi:hypothetical protein
MEGTTSAILQDGVKVWHFKACSHRVVIWHVGYLIRRTAKPEHFHSTLPYLSTVPEIRWRILEPLHGISVCHTSSSPEAIDGDRRDGNDRACG